MGKKQIKMTHVHHLPFRGLNTANETAQRGLVGGVEHAGVAASLQQRPHSLRAVDHSRQVPTWISVLP